MNSNDFAYYVETIGDVKILRYRIPGWELLTKRQKNLLWCLYNAALYGRDIIYDQLFRYGLYIRRVLELILRTNLYVEPPSELTEDPQWPLFVEYIYAIWFSNGIHQFTSNEKIIPRFTREYFIQLMHTVRMPIPPLGCNLLDIIFDPKVFPMRTVDNSIEESAVNFTFGLSTDEAIEYYQKLDDSDLDKLMDNPTYEPEEHGLNSQIRKDSNGDIPQSTSQKIIKETWKVGGMYGAALAKCVEWIDKAVTWAENPTQKKSLEALAKYYRTGSLRDYIEYCKLWVADTTSTIDMIHGFIEVYNDPLGHSGSFESIVMVTDPEATQRIKLLQNNAQWFEDHSPVLPQHRRKVAKGVDARVVNVVVESGDAAPTTPIGVNLPNAEWFRTKYGSKSVNLANIVYAYDRVSDLFSVTEEFYLPETYARLSKLTETSMAVMVDMHEVLGHGSGQMEPGVGDASTALGAVYNVLEEARADLFACYFILDPYVVQIGLLQDLSAGEVLYDIEITNGLLMQLSKVKLPEGGYIRDSANEVTNKIKLSQPHMRDRQLIASWVFEHGLADGSIECVSVSQDVKTPKKSLKTKSLKRKNSQSLSLKSKISQSLNSKTYFKINNYERCRELFGELLREIQRIKSQGDRVAGEKLVEQYGTWIDPDLHEEAVARFAQYDMAPFSAFIQPELTKDEKGDINVTYSNNFMGQMLHYADVYSTLDI